ncbi:class I SAM-dependent methyltransferase [Ulvibacterium marinum]|uniref:Class I SAM-dependent methyltransferase n=1 Tax=Ulvibacterium marinum TaxID=2419782 RepID=A0A3B0C3Y7_9FLAO|nr:class I SAM-dependent methyltransferase [Ulvibacterium marinum]RKN80130.1 class I SAM-dependent methyltransferase [Ulvibacterium marinum]
MKRAKDKFSKQSKAYKKFRPTYPSTLYEELLKWVHTKDVCWDCGTGNGQVASALSPYFRTVFATDISQKQIQNAGNRDNVIFKVERAENTNFQDSQFDLITVAQAIHWFDSAVFNSEVRRVGKNGGVLAVWGYGLLRISPAIDELIAHFYKDIIGPYWDKERKHIDAAYETIDLDFQPLAIDSNFAITVQWDLRSLRGYLNTWSSVQNYMGQNNGENPVDGFMDKLKSSWGDTEQKSINFPIFMRAFRIEK